MIIEDCRINIRPSLTHLDLLHKFLVESFHPASLILDDKHEPLQAVTTDTQHVLTTLQVGRVAVHVIVRDLYARCSPARQDLDLLFYGLDGLVSLQVRLQQL